MGWIAGFAFHGTMLYWIFNTCLFAGLSIRVGLLAWTSLAAFLALNWGIIGALGRTLIAGSGPLRPWAWAALWTAVSAASAWWTPRLGVDLLAYTQYRNPSLIQLGALAGPHGLGFLIVLFNAALLDAWRESRGGEAAREGDSPWRKANMAWAVALVALCWIYGKAELTRRDFAVERNGAMARVEILQPNIDQYQKWDGDFVAGIEANFTELLALPRLRPPELIVWPEAALPWIVRKGRGLDWVSSWSRRLGAFQLVGAVSMDSDGQRNSAFLLGPDGGLTGTYHKRELVPFGERVPFQAFLGRYIGILNLLGDTLAGEPDQPILSTPLGPAAVSICYEAMFPRWARRDAARGAKLIINITNDGWYKDTWGPVQHFHVNRFRAIENRVTVIRSGNTGISGVIDPWGVVTARLELGARGRLDAEVPLRDFFPEGSPYSRRGDLLGGACLLAALGMGLLRWRGRGA